MTWTRILWHVPSGAKSPFGDTSAWLTLFTTWGHWTIELCLVSRHRIGWWTWGILQNLLSNSQTGEKHAGKTQTCRAQDSRNKDGNTWSNLNSQANAPKTFWSLVVFVTFCGRFIQIVASAAIVDTAGQLPGKNARFRNYYLEIGGSAHGPHHEFTFQEIMCICAGAYVVWSCQKLRLLSIAPRKLPLVMRNGSCCNPLPAIEVSASQIW